MRKDVFEIPQMGERSDKWKKEIQAIKDMAKSEESFDGRRGASCWNEFQEFEKEVKFKIRTEVNSIKTRGEESIKRANDSVGISMEKFEKIKTEQEIKIQEIKIKGMKLGKKAQEVVDILSNEIKEKIKKGEHLEGAVQEENLIQDEISKQIEKIQKMYKDFLQEIEEVRKRIDELLFSMESDLRKIRIKEVEENIKNI